MKALEGAFIKEKTQVGAFSGHCEIRGIFPLFLVRCPPPMSAMMMDGSRQLPLGWEHSWASRHEKYWPHKLGAPQKYNRIETRSIVIVRSPFEPKILLAGFKYKSSNT